MCLNRWSPCYQAVLHFSSQADISALLPPCLEPGEVVPVGWRWAELGLSVTVRTGTGWRRECWSWCSPLTPDEEEGQGERKNPTSGKPSQDKSSLEGKGTSVFKAATDRWVMVAAAKGVWCGYRRKAGKGSPECWDVLLPSALLLVKVEQSLILVQSLSTQVSPGALRATRVMMTEQCQPPFRPSVRPWELKGTDTQGHWSDHMQTSRTVGGTGRYLTKKWSLAFTLFSVCLLCIHVQGIWSICTGPADITWDLLETKGDPLKHHGWHRAPDFGR